MRKLLLLFLVLFWGTKVFTQSSCKVSGRITDENGDAVPYASIYVPALSKGSMANIDGEYSFSVPCNTYKIQFQCLGYQLVTTEKTLNGNTPLNIQLKTTAVQIKEVSIDPSQEDIAYNYIRKATAMAVYYRKQIQAYQCNLYVRSFYDPKKIPWIAKKLVSEEELKEMSTGDISETLLEYSFQRPNTVSEKILAKKSGSLDTLQQGSQYINLSFYELGGEGIINPLSRNAFQVYRFEHVSSYFEGSNQVHKIKIIPRRKGNDLMKGHLYINDKLWNINKVDVRFEQPLAKFKYQQTYHEVAENTWMPTHHKIEVGLAIMGFQMDIHYLATLSKLKVETDPLVDQQIKENLQLAPPDQLESDSVPAKRNIKRSKTEAKIESLLTKEKISKTESLKLVRLIKKQERIYEKQQDSINQLEVTSERKIEYADSAFSSNDSLWESGREVPLSSRETSIYHSRDSLEKEKRGDTVYSDPNQSWMNKILYFDRPLNAKNKNIRFQPKGLLQGLTSEFNTVDGFWVDKELFTFEWNNREGKRYTFTPHVGYLFARKTWTASLDYHSQYNLKRRAGFYGAVGRKSADFDREEPMSNFANTFSSLFLKNNYKKVYQSDYLHFGHQIDLTNGLQLKTGVEYEDRSPLKNNSSYSLNRRSNRAYTENIPEHVDVSALSNSPLLNQHQALSFDIKLSYTPKQYFRIRNHNKEMLRSNYPSFHLNYRHGLSGVAESDVNYQFLSFGIEQSTSVQLIDRLVYHLEVGQFLSSENLFFADYKNFNAQPNYVLSNLQSNSFFLLDNYRYSTKQRYFEGHLSLEDNRLLLKRIPFLNTLNFTESLHFNALSVKHIPQTYTEVGYTVNKVFLVGTFGVFASFQGNEYSSWGIRLGLVNF